MKSSDPDILKNSSLSDDDPTAAARKQDHIELAFQSQVSRAEVDGRFSYEPLLAAHPAAGSLPVQTLAGKTIRTPIWVSSMTGGTTLAAVINENLARACQEFGMGMGLGSCRPLLYSDDRLSDFAVRPIIGAAAPLFANLGIAQLETLVERAELWRINALLDKLSADGLIIHINPLQEWLQPEGDRFKVPPLAIVEAVLQHLKDTPVIVKEVGQGMGEASLRALLQLPLAALDFAANGGTNFSKLELLRTDPIQQEAYAPLANIGHGAEEMLEIVNRLVQEMGDAVRCPQLIISGGVGNFLDGYYYTQKSTLDAIYGQASAFLRHARGDYQDLHHYVATQVRGLELAHAYLRVR